MEDFLQHIHQDVLNGVGDDSVQSIGQHPPVLIEESVGAVFERLVPIEQIGEMRFQPIQFEVHANISHIVEGETAFFVQPGFRIHDHGHVL